MAILSRITPPAALSQCHLNWCAGPCQSKSATPKDAIELADKNRPQASFCLAFLSVRIRLVSRIKKASQTEAFYLAILSRITPPAALSQCHLNWCAGPCQSKSATPKDAIELADKNRPQASFCLAFLSVRIRLVSRIKKGLPNGGFLFGDPGRIRTCDPQLRRLLLYPAELRDQPWPII